MVSITIKYAKKKNIKKRNKTTVNTRRWNYPSSYIIFECSWDNDLTRHKKKYIRLSVCTNWKTSDFCWKLKISLNSDAYFEHMHRYKTIYSNRELYECYASQQCSLIKKLTVRLSYNACVCDAKMILFYFNLNFCSIYNPNTYTILIIIINLRERIRKGVGTYINSFFQGIKSKFVLNVNCNSSHM